MTSPARLSVQLSQRGRQLDFDLIRRGHRHPPRVPRHRDSELVSLPPATPRQSAQLLGERPHDVHVGQEQPRGQRAIGGGQGQRDRLLPQVQERLVHHRGEDDAAFHGLVHLLRDRRGVTFCLTVAQEHPRSGYAEPISDASQDVHVDDLAAFEDLAHLRLGLVGQLRDLALTHPEAVEQRVQGADVQGVHRGVHVVAVEELGVNLRHGWGAPRFWSSRLDGTQGRGESILSSARFGVLVPASCFGPR